MSIYIGGQPSSNRNPLLSILITIATFACIYFAAKGLFWVLQWAAIYLAIATLIIDYKVVIDYFKWLGTLVQRSPLSGVAMGALTIMAYPVLIAFLFFKALIKRSFKKIINNQQQQYDPNQQQTSQYQDEYIEYEEIKEEPIERPKVKVRDSSDRDFV
jgi:hypothetical protein